MKKTLLLITAISISAGAFATEGTNSSPNESVEKPQEVVASTVAIKSVEDKIADALNEHIGTASYLYIEPLRETGLHAVNHNGHYVLVNEDASIYLSGYQLDIKNKVNLKEQWKKETITSELAKLNEGNYISYPPSGEPIDVLWVFSDISCGYCGMFHKKIPELTEQGIEVRVIPFVRGLHGNASKHIYDTTLAIYAETDQAKRRELHDKAFSRKSISPSFGLSVEAIEIVDKGFLLGQMAEVRGTPAFLNSNGNLQEGLVPVKELVENFIPSE